LQGLTPVTSWTRAITRCPSRYASTSDVDRHYSLEDNDAASGIMVWQVRPEWEVTRIVGNTYYTGGKLEVSETSSSEHDLYCD
jgi:hypothetical protein